MDSQAQGIDGTSYAPSAAVLSGADGTASSSPLSDGNSESWQAKYNGLQGAFKADRERFGKEIEALEASSKTHAARVKELEALVQANEAQLQELPAVRQALAEKEQALSSAALQTERQGLLLKHRVFDDALVKLVVSSQLPTEELEETIAAFAQASTAQQQAAIAKAAEGSVASSNPPSASGGVDQLKALQEKLDTAMREGRYDGENGFWQLNEQYVRLTAELRSK